MKRTIENSLTLDAAKGILHYFCGIDSLQYEVLKLNNGFNYLEADSLYTGLPYKVHSNTFWNWYSNQFDIVAIEFANILTMDGEPDNSIELLANRFSIFSNFGPDEFYPHSKVHNRITQEIIHLIE